MGRKKLPYKLTKRSSGIWYYNISGIDKWKSTGEKDRTFAEMFVNKKLETVFEERDETLTFGEYAEHFFIEGKCPFLKTEKARGKKPAKSTARWRRNIFTVHVLPQWNNKPLSEITVREIENWAYSIDRAPATAKHAFDTFGIVMTTAWRDGVITNNPFPRARPPVVKNRPRDVLTWEEFKLIFGGDTYYFHGKMNMLFHLMASTGLRSGEIRALQYGAIHWDKGGLMVVQAVNSSKEIGPVKKDEVRAILLPQVTLEKLKAYCREEDIKRPNDFVFPTFDNGSAHYSGYIKEGGYLGKRFKEGIAKALTDKEIGARSLSPHCLRHGYNTRMKELFDDASIDGLWNDKTLTIGRQLKSSDEIVRAMTGHRSAQMTEHYNHPDLIKNLERISRFRDVVDRFWGE